MGIITRIKQSVNTEHYYQLKMFTFSYFHILLCKWKNKGLFISKLDAWQIGYLSEIAYLKPVLCLLQIAIETIQI
jgi:hypothetical protein